jgi:phospholipase C
MTAMPQIETVVVLMLENRSLDNVLGWLHQDGKPINIWPKGDLPQRFDGIRPSDVNWKGDTMWRPTNGYASMGSQRWRMPRWDPKEGIFDVHRQMYARADGIVLDTDWGSNIPMGGFAQDFPAGNDSGVGDVMGAYNRDDLPVLYGLAENFAVSDRWFASVPSETDPNRGFALTGTSEGDEYALQFKIFNGPTLFGGLNATNSNLPGGKSWGIFYRDTGPSSMAPKGSICYTEGKFTQVRSELSQSNGRGQVTPYADFLKALQGGAPIPQFCYVEPSWGWGWGEPGGDDFRGMQGTDYHPPAWVGPGEWYLNELYVALRNSPQWNNMLFVIVFDEHGGTWDHVAPPRCENPDGIVAKFPVPFEFKRMGPRVPALLVSPFVAPRTVFRAPPGSRAAYDHTSLIKTVLNWAGTKPGYIAKMGQRVVTAPPFDGVLSPTIVQPNAVRDFKPPLSFRDQCPLGKHRLLMTNADLLSRDDHHVAEAAANNVDEYIAELTRIAASKSDALKMNN